VADAFVREASRIHHASAGEVDKSAAYGAIIQAGLDRIDEVERRLRDQ
jgi:hypothetical protein